MKLIVRGVVCEVKPGVLFVFISYLYREHDEAGGEQDTVLMRKKY